MGEDPLSALLGGFDGGVSEQARAIPGSRVERGKVKGGSWGELVAVVGVSGDRSSFEQRIRIGGGDGGSWRRVHGMGRGEEREGKERRKKTAGAMGKKNEECY